MAKQMLENANKGKVIGKKKQASASSKYCLYLLRGGPKQKHAYVGVTNKNPQLRLKQHNGLLRGGAAPTAKYRGTWWLHLVVRGLKSKKAALVLEHAVQQPTALAGRRGGTGDDVHDGRARGACLLGARGGLRGHGHLGRRRRGGHRGAGRRARGGRGRAR